MRAAAVEQTNEYRLGHVDGLAAAAKELQERDRTIGMLRASLAAYDAQIRAMRAAIILPDDAPVTVEQRIEDWCRRHPALAALLATGAVCTVFGIMVGSVINGWPS